MQVSWVDLNSTAASIKALCPEPFLFYNEGGAPLWGNYNINHEHTECEPSPTPPLRTHCAAVAIEGAVPQTRTSRRRLTLSARTTVSRTIIAAR